MSEKPSDACKDAEGHKCMCAYRISRDVFVCLFDHVRVTLECTIPYDFMITPLLYM